MTRVLIAFTLAAAACTIEPADAERTVHLLEVPTWTVEVDALLPSDVQPRGDGFVVLDGYDSAMLWWTDKDAAPSRVEVPGRPIRMVPSGERWLWLVDPGSSDRDAALLRVDAAGAVVSAVAPVFANGDPLDPVSMIVDGDMLVVGSRHNGVRWLDPETGVVTRELTRDIDDLEIGLVDEVSRLPNGDLLALDATTPRVHVIGAEGEAVRAFGTWGLWEGRMHRPRSLVPADGGGLLMADAGLGAVQLFSEQGVFAGVIGAAGERLDVHAPVAVRQSGPGRYLVLDAGDSEGHPAKVVGFELTEAQVVEAIAADRPRRLRTPLVADPEREGPAGRKGQVCLGCHDGIVNDSRAVWDGNLNHHPFNVPMGFKIPEELSTTSDGSLFCGTCHTPHAVSGETFLRMSKTDGALCHACHGENAHETVADSLPVPGGAHPTGRGLREGAADVAARDCDACHTVHGAKQDPLLRDGTDLVVCLACHDGFDGPRHHKTESRTGLDVKASERAAKLALALGGGTGCRTCHDLVGGRGKGLLRTQKDGGLVCLTCHTDRIGVATGPHRKAARDGVPCLGCHNPHGGDPKRHLLVTRATPEDPAGCRTCHDKARHADRGPGHPVGGDTAPTCLECHEPHTTKIRPEAACASCHKTQQNASGHGKVKCASCHPPHAAPPRAQVVGVNPDAQPCLACHLEGGDGPTIAAWQHPAPVFTPDGGRWTPLTGLTLFARDGRQVAPGHNGDLSCGTCHAVHGTGQDALRKAEGWQKACSACHGDEGLVLYRWYHRPDRRGSR